MFANRPPQNVREVFTKDGSRFFVVNGAQNVVGGDNKRKFISVNFDEEIKRHKASIPAIEQELRSLVEERVQVERERNKVKGNEIEVTRRVNIYCVDEMEKIKNVMHKGQTKINALQREIHELESVREEPPADTTDIEENLKVTSYSKTIP
jgi:chromosome segregation ATPase